MYDIINKRTPREETMLQFLLTISDEKYHPKIEYLYNTFHHKMIAYAEMKFYSYGRKNVKEDAEDAVQSTFLNMVKYINSIDFSRSEQELGNYPKWSSCTKNTINIFTITLFYSHFLSV